MAENVLIRKIMARVERVDGHWLWQGAMIGEVPIIYNPDQVRSGTSRRGNTAMVRRLLFEHHHQQLPNQHLARVYRTCDQPRCVNPEHMLLRGERPPERVEQVERVKRVRKGKNRSREVRPYKIEWPQVERMLSRVERVHSPEGEHWLGDFTLTKSGTSITTVMEGRSGHRQGRSVSVARYLWLAEGRPLPDGDRLLRTCSEPRCVNPAHRYATSRSVAATANVHLGADREQAIRNLEQGLCLRGHDDMAYFAGGRAECRECRRQRQRGQEHHARRAERRRLARQACLAQHASGTLALEDGQGAHPPMREEAYDHDQGSGGTDSA